ncbi:MlaD family protein [Candidatus Deferrimicrobium sp.]|uniref:MlaD family protein n=1 Tax=Candidatus Deferrimicrobium sp. TaxID=3060586 RepID=UPI002725125B|nr:MlaD family protein [Candidatus Deferrimicrobium sp.]MDO8738492.1 MlaD family protein [Candidatus Deferrimicrobium sp.]
MSREARVGIFVLLGLIVLTFFTFRVSKWGLIAEKGYRLTVDFDTAAGLEPKSDVKMAGVPIGKVEEIQLVGNRARLVLRIHQGIRIPIDSVGTIQTQGLLGEKYVEILPGKDAQRNLPAGGQVANTLSPTNLDEMVRKLSSIGDDVKKFTESLSATFGTEEGKKALGDILRDVRDTTASLRTVVQGNEQRFERILANVDRLSANLSDISAANKEDVRATIANLRAISDTLKSETPGLVRKLEEMSERVSNIAGDNRENLKESIQNLKTASARLDNTLDAAGKVMAKIDRGEGTLGKLVTDNTAYTSLTDTLDGINRYVRKGEQLKTFIDYHLEWQQTPSEFKHYLNLRLQPTADKYYTIGVVDDPRGKFSSETRTLTTTPGSTVTTQEDKYENKLKVSALIARKFSGLTVKGGVIESTGGLGLDYELLKNRLTVGADAWDFSRKDLPPHLKLYGSYDIVKNLFVTGGVDDVLATERNLRTLFIGFGIKFADEDIKTVLGAVPIKP